MVSRGAGAGADDGAGRMNGSCEKESTLRTSCGFAMAGCWL
jgi:hypothetical protein